jgi:hypothetical protein
MDARKISASVIAKVLAMRARPRRPSALRDAVLELGRNWGVPRGRRGACSDRKNAFILGNSEALG